MSRLRITAVLAALLVGAVPAAANATPASGQIRLGGAEVVPGSYLVVLRPDADAGPTTALATRLGGRIGYRYDSALRGFEVSLSETAARRLAAHPAVEYVERNAVIQIDTSAQSDPAGTDGGAGDVGTQAVPWGLDRIDQTHLPLDGSYTPVNSGSGVRVYVTGTGVRKTHTDFGGRVIDGWDFIDNDGNASDCNGLSTHHAGTIGGAQYGVAKSVTMVAVRNVNCNGSASLAQIIASINWLTANAVKPAVVLLPIGSGVNTTLEAAIKNSIASGLPYVVGAGSSNTDACNFSPGRIPEAITVSATTNTDNRASFANYGPCVDLFAPGVSIQSAWHTSDTATNVISGSTSAAHVTGAAALWLQSYPAWSPAQLSNVINAFATPGVVINPGPGSPNRLLWVN